MNATRVIGIAMCVMGYLAVASAPARADVDGEWKVIETTGSEPSARGAHGAVRVGNRMYVFGGFLERDNQPPSTVPDFYEFYNDLSISTPKPMSGPRSRRVARCRAYAPSIA